MGAKVRERRKKIEKFHIFLKCGALLSEVLFILTKWGGNLSLLQ